MAAITEPLGTLAAEFGMTRDVLRRICAEARVRPCGKRRGHPIYRLKDVYAAIVDQQKPETLNPYARLALARAILAEDQIRLRRGELVEATDAQRAIARLCLHVAQALETVTDVIERDVGLSAKQAVRLEQHLDACREQLHQEILDDLEKDDAA